MWTIDSSPIVEGKEAYCTIDCNSLCYTLSRAILHPEMLNKMENYRGDILHDWRNILSSLEAFRNSGKKQWTAQVYARNCGTYLVSPDLNMGSWIMVKDIHSHWHARATLHFELFPNCTEPRYQFTFLIHRIFDT